MTPAAMIEQELAAAKVALQDTSLPLPIRQTDERPKLSDGGYETRRLQSRWPAAVHCSAWLGIRSDWFGFSIRIVIESSRDGEFLSVDWPSHHCYHLRNESVQR